MLADSRNGSTSTSVVYLTGDAVMLCSAQRVGARQQASALVPAISSRHSPVAAQTRTPQHPDVGDCLQAVSVLGPDTHWISGTEKPPVSADLPRHRREARSGQPSNRRRVKVSLGTPVAEKFAPLADAPPIEVRVSRPKHMTL